MDVSYNGLVNSCKQYCYNWREPGPPVSFPGVDHWIDIDNYSEEEIDAYPGSTAEITESGGVANYDLDPDCLYKFKLLFIPLETGIWGFQSIGTSGARDHTVMEIFNSEDSSYFAGLNRLLKVPDGDNDGLSTCYMVKNRVYCIVARASCTSDIHGQFYARVKNPLGTFIEDLWLLVPGVLSAYSWDGYVDNAMTFGVF